MPVSPQHIVLAPLRLDATVDVVDPSLEPIMNSKAETVSSFQAMRAHVLLCAASAVLESKRDADELDAVVQPPTTSELEGVEVQASEDAVLVDEEQESTVKGPMRRTGSWMGPGRAILADEEEDAIGKELEQAT